MFHITRRQSFCHFTASRTLGPLVLGPLQKWFVSFSLLCACAAIPYMLWSAKKYETLQWNISSCDWKTDRKKPFSALQRILFFLRSSRYVAVAYSPWYLLSGYSEPYVLKCSSISAFCSLQIHICATKLWNEHVKKTCQTIRFHFESQSLVISQLVWHHLL